MRYLWHAETVNKRCILCKQSPVYHIQPANARTSALFEGWRYYCPRCGALVEVEEEESTLPPYAVRALPMCLLSVED